jgi:4,5-dihydroxyphthalate decarboxylase
MSSNLKLTLACGDYEITRPLADGRVKPDGIDLTVLTRPGSRERHWRMARGNEYDVCEYNAPSYVMARDRGMGYTSLPVFLHRRFRQGFLFVNPNKGITKPSDLIGKRIGGTNFGPAANIWMRGILEEHYGLPHKEVTWVTERPEDIDFTPAPGLKIERVASDSLDDMLIAGEIEALLQPSFPRAFLDGNPNIVRLWPNYRQVELDYYRKTNIFPIMHTTVIREDIIEKHPWVAGSLTRAFQEAKTMAYERVRNPRVVPLAWWSAEWEAQNEILGPDPWAYGLGPANRNNLEVMVRYTHQQGLISRAIPIEELFVDLDLDILGHGDTY